MQLTSWHRRTAAQIAAAHPLDGRPARATGNHLVAQNDEPEPNSHVHPAFAGLLNAFASAPADALAAQRAAYVTLLQRHDWEYEFSDDHSVWSRGRDERAQLRMLQRELDADRVLWNQHAPAAHRLQVLA